MVEGVNKCMGTHPELCDAEGVLDHTRILRECPSFFEPVTNGIEYIIFSAELEALIPELPDFLSNAGNAGHGSERKETPVQCLLQVHNRIQQEQFKDKEKKGLILEDIAKKLEQSKPQLIGHAHDYASYVATFGGGPGAPYLKELDNWSKQLRRRRTVPSSQFGLLAKVKVPDIHTYINAISMASMCAPDHPSYVVRGESKLWSNFDCTQAQSKLKPKVLAANEKMIAARAWMLSLSLESRTAVGLYGDYFVRLVMTIHSKKAETATANYYCESIEECTEEFLRACRKNGINMDDCPFTAVEKPAEPNVPVAAKGEGQTIREYRLDGKLSLINLTRANLDVGAIVQKLSKADPANFKILAIDESSNQVSLEAENCSVDTVTFSDLLDNYKETKRVKEVLLLSKDIPPPKMTDADIDLAKSAVRVAVHDLWPAYRDGQHVNLVAAPKKRVLASKALKKGELTLLAWSTAVGCTATADVPAAAVVLDFSVKNSKGDKVEFYLTAPKQIWPAAVLAQTKPNETVPANHDDAKALVPFWFVRSTSNAEAVNSKICFATYTLQSERTTRVRVKVPYLTNSRAIAADEELFLQEATKPTTARQPRTVIVQMSSASASPPKEAKNEPVAKNGRRVE